MTETRNINARGIVLGKKRSCRPIQRSRIAQVSARILQLAQLAQLAQLRRIPDGVLVPERMGLWRGMAWL